MAASPQRPVRMARLLPSTPDLSAADEPAPRVIGLEGEDADELLAAISSGTARRLLTALHEEPAAPSELADRVDTSLQNAQYHLGKLEAAGMIEVIDTVYSEKGREMKVYAPADRPLVVVAGGEEATSSLRTAVGQLLGAVAGLALVSLLVQTALRGFPLLGQPGATTSGGGDGGDAGVMTAAEATPSPAPAPEAAAGGGLPLDVLAEPGVLFFAGGLAVLLVLLGVWYVRRDRS